MGASSSDGDLVWLGIALGVFASMTGTIGKQLLRLSGVLYKKKLVYNSKVALACGLFLNALVGPIVDMASYAFAPQSIIAPLAGLDVVWNTSIAPCTLGETLTKPVIFGVFLIATGATGTSFFGNREDKEYTIDMIKEQFTRWAVLIYGIVLIVWLAFNILFLQRRTPVPKDGAIVSTPSDSSIKSDSARYVKGDLKDTIRGLSLGMTAGSIAGNMFCVKGFIELVQASIRDEDSSIWSDYLPYVLLVGAIGFAVSNLYFLTKAMREYEALFMGAVFEGTGIVCGSISGVIVYSDLDALEWRQRILYFVFLGSIVCGVLIVAFNSRTDLEKDVERQTNVIGKAMREAGQVKVTEHDDTLKDKDGNVMRSPSSKSRMALSPHVHTPSRQVSFQLSLDESVDRASSPHSDPRQDESVINSPDIENRQSPEHDIVLTLPKKVTDPKLRRAAEASQSPQEETAEAKQSAEEQKLILEDLEEQEIIADRVVEPTAVGLSKLRVDEQWSEEERVTIEEPVKTSPAKLSSGLVCCSCGR